MLAPVLLEVSHSPKDPSLILAVSDNPDFLNLLCTVLQGKDLNVLTAENGAKALDLARDLRPHLIISGVVMPGIDGIELCRRLKASPLTRDIPTLLLSAARYDEADIIEGLRAGADDYIPANVPIELLRKKAEYLIDEHKRLEAARLETERNFQSLIENSLDIVTILNADGTIRYESPSVEDVLGYKPRELIGRSAFELIHPEDASKVIKVFNQGVQTERYTARLEFRFRHKDGSWRVLEAIGKNLLDEPRVAGVIVNSRDITERKRIDAVLRSTDARYRLAVDTVKDYAIFMLDPQGYFVSANSGAEHINGYRADEIIGQHLSRFYGEADVEQGKPAEQLWAAMTEGSCEYEGWCVRKDGSQFWANVVLTALRDEQGNLEGFLKVTRNTTERRAREEALRETEKLLQAILDNSPALIYIKDMDGRYTLVNRQFEKLLGLTKTEIIGKTAYDLFPKEIADAFRGDDQQVIESSSPLETEKTAVLKDGTHHYVSTEFPLIDSTGRLHAICGMSTDVTGYKSLVDQLRHSQKMEAIGTLAAGVAHDFNNMLTAILGYSQLLLNGFDKNDLRRRQIEEIEKAGRRAAALTNQLLAFCRKQILQPRLLDLNRVVENLTGMLQRLIGEDVELVAVLDPQLAMVKADPNSIEQVIMNLAINARDAMPQGGKLTVETANIVLDSEYAGAHMGVSVGDYVMLAVSDTGFGMDKETQARIFDPFFTTKEQGKGTGLGLSTVYGIVKQSGGHIWVYSEHGHGSTFKIYVPRADDTTEIAEGEVVRSSARKSDGGATILLVEDEKLVRKLARTILEMYGYSVLEAAGAREALQRAQDYSEEIHVLITDVVMPELDGRALANSIGVTRRDIRVLYLSGYTDEAILQHGLLEQGMAFLQKPFTPEMLARKVREVLDA